MTLFKNVLSMIIIIFQEETKIDKDNLKSISTLDLTITNSSIIRDKVI